MMTILKKQKAVLLGIYTLLTVFHFVIKDHIQYLSAVFYATPLILIIALGYLITYLFQKTRFFYIIVSVQLILSIVWVKNNIYFNHTKTKELNTVLFWNLAKKKDFPLSIIKQQIKTYNPEFLAFVEDKSSFNKKTISNYNYKKIADNMSILYLGELIDISFFYKEENYKLNTVTIKYKNKTTNYLITDIYANPLTNKEKAHKEIVKISTKKNTDIILGDFNTPYESIHFEDYKTNYNSFRTKSNGVTATWFYGLPLLELDQIWLNKKHQTTLLEKKQFINSDHKLLIASFIKQ